MDGVKDFQGDIQKLFSPWENESGLKAEDLEAACKHIIHTQDLWTGLVEPFSKISWAGFTPFTATKAKIGFIPKGNFKKFISKVYMPVCVENLKVCSEDEGASMYGSVSTKKGSADAKDVETVLDPSPTDKSPNSNPVDPDKVKANAGAFENSADSVYDELRL